MVVSNGSIEKEREDRHALFAFHSLLTSVEERKDERRTHLSSNFSSLVSVWREILEIYGNTSYKSKGLSGKNIRPTEWNGDPTSSSTPAPSLIGYHSLPSIKTSR